MAALPDNLYIRAAAFSRDGRFLATTTPGDTMQIWEVATWTQRNEFKGHRDRPTTLTFAPNGQLLSGSLDTTVLVSDTRPPHVAAFLTLAVAWDNLAQRESAESFRSEERFQAYRRRTRSGLCRKNPTDGGRPIPAGSLLARRSWQ